MQTDVYDIAIVGAGVFGSWIAHRTSQAGRRVVLIDAHGPASSRASSGGESRIIRMCYGADEIYTRWAMRSLELWKQFFAQSGEPLFHNTGVLLTARPGSAYFDATKESLARAAAPFELIESAELHERYPQIRLPRGSSGLLEPASGVILARRAVAAVVREAVRAGLTYIQTEVLPPGRARRLEAVRTRSGDRVTAEKFVFACGPWMPHLFPDLLGGIIRPTRQVVFFFGPPAGDPMFAPPRMPVWLDFAAGVYTVPSLENRGFKIGLDEHGPRFDPEAGERALKPEDRRVARSFLAKYLPRLRDAPMVESRVCQYENTHNGDFLIDRHPDFDNVWLVGGGSGHGFKHGPMMGEYVAGLLDSGAAPEPRFALARKRRHHKRTVF